MSTFQLKLYITGRSQRTERAIANLRSSLERELKGDFELLVNNVLQHPEIAEEQKLLATPTLIKELPLPAKRIIGDFSDAEKVLNALDLQPLQGGGNDER